MGIYAAQFYSIYNYHFIIKTIKTMYECKRVLLRVGETFKRALASKEFSICGENISITAGTISEVKATVEMRETLN